MRCLGCSAVCALRWWVFLLAVLFLIRDLYFVSSHPGVLCNFRHSESFLSSAARLDCVICKEECWQLHDSACSACDTEDQASVLSPSLSTLAQLTQDLERASVSGRGVT